MVKHYEPEFRDLHPQVRHTAQWIFEKETRTTTKTREEIIHDSMFAAKKHCEKKYGIKSEEKPPWA